MKLARDWNVETCSTLCQLTSCLSPAPRNSMIKAMARRSHPSCPFSLRESKRLSPYRAGRDRWRIFLRYNGNQSALRSRGQLPTPVAREATFLIRTSMPFRIGSALHRIVEAMALSTLSCSWFGIWQENNVAHLTAWDPATADQQEAEFVRFAVHSGDRSLGRGEKRGWSSRRGGRWRFLSKASDIAGRGARC